LPVFPACTDNATAGNFLNADNEVLLLAGIASPAPFIKEAERRFPKVVPMLFPDHAGKQALVTTDLLLEGIHFDLTYAPLKHIGYKATMANFSDVYAMNGKPRQITVSLGISKRFCIVSIR
jgi:hypothetical protein